MGQRQFYCVFFFFLVLSVEAHIPVHSLDFYGFSVWGWEPVMLNIRHDIFMKSCGSDACQYVVCLSYFVTTKLVLLSRSAVIGAGTILLKAYFKINLSHVVILYMSSVSNRWI